MKALFQNLAPEHAQFDFGIIITVQGSLTVRHAIYKQSLTGSEHTGFSYHAYVQVGSGRVKEMVLTLGQFQSYIHKTVVNFWLASESAEGSLQLFNERHEPVSPADLPLAFNVPGTPRLNDSDFVVSLGSTDERPVYGQRWYGVEDFERCQIAVLTLWPIVSGQLGVLDVDGQPVKLTLSQWSSLRDLWKDINSETKIAVLIDECGYQKVGSSEFITTFTPLGIVKNGFKAASNERFNESQCFMELRACEFFSYAKKPWVAASECLAIGFCENSNQVVKVDRQQKLNLTVLSFNQCSDSWVIGFEDAPIAVFEVPRSTEVVMFREQHVQISAVLIDGQLVNPTFKVDYSSEPRSSFLDWAEVLTKTWPLDGRQDIYNVIRH